MTNAGIFVRGVCEMVYKGMFNFASSVCKCTGARGYAAGLYRRETTNTNHLQVSQGEVDAAGAAVMCGIVLWTQDVQHDQRHAVSLRLG